MYILGISAFYHDAAAALIKDGEIIAAAQEERFSRIRHDENFPIQAVKYCLDEAAISVDDIHAVVFYEKPFIKFERLLETYLSIAPKGIVSFLKAMPVWSKKKLFIKKIIKDALSGLSESTEPAFEILFSEHHLSHAASAWFTAPFKDAAVLTVDAVGESVTTSIFHATGNKLVAKKEMHFPHSVGLLYSSFTYYLGFTVNSGEYKLMGLAPYGDKTAAETKFFKSIITEKLCRVYDDGSVFLCQKYFNYTTGLTMVNEKAWENLFGIGRRKDDETITMSHCNMAMAIQLVTEEIVVKMAKEARAITGSDNLCMAGGVALNCVANSKLQQAGIFNNIHIQPAAGDAGAAIGAALTAFHIFYENEKPVEGAAMHGAYLGPAFSNDAVLQVLKKYRASYIYHEAETLYDWVAEQIDAGMVVGWFQGRMEFGPRALGNRSIIADPRKKSMQQQLNLKIKFRESFRPFAPAVLAERARDFFNMDIPSPYMLYVKQVKDFAETMLQEGSSMEQKSAAVNNALPAITHVDGTARVQTVDAKTNPEFYALLSAFEKRTGCPVLVNTSFNRRGEPIVCSPEDALRCFMNTGMDVLVMNNYVLLKSGQQLMKPIGYPKSAMMAD